MAHFQISRKTRLRAVIAISVTFFLAEISTGFYTKSLALVADAFHYLTDLIGFIVALVAVHMQERKDAPVALSFGWARASLLGAFFNGVFLLALGLSILLQSVERFIDIKEVEKPEIVLIVGSVGLALNLISGIFLHEHDHGDGHEHAVHIDELAGLNHSEHNHHNLLASKKHRDLGMLGAMIHVLGDAFNNIGVIISALVIWLTHSPKRFYIDPAISLYIALMILGTAIPLTRRSGTILLESAPDGVVLDHVKKDLESIPGVLGVHELHVWRLNQTKSLASAHIVVRDTEVRDFIGRAKIISECLHAYGIHSATLQPELADGSEVEPGGEAQQTEGVGKCTITCGTFCEPLKCCN
ncbi:cation efflux system protein czcD [Paraphaeosphaeria sporulosa]|uniref:Cation efflux system protein czcD n=1 Tax=Paraphaeosphaeria sporulosa TaxID=1460663 RepID=A0A177C5V4_9PLEO|nr:cation efflux system protein czcD [Paraphaeosphaeria sporulosa]OAG03003.1 cation efflux system protein czcD [Paraphaeosphaeria sporulosa]